MSPDSPDSHKKSALTNIDTLCYKLKNNNKKFSIMLNVKKIQHFCMPKRQIHDESVTKENLQIFSLLQIHCVFLHNQ